METRFLNANRKMDQFPRSSNIPKQSPIFWVGQKDRYLRQLLIRDIEALTGRRLLVYYANRFLGAEINQRDCDYFVELFGDIHGEACDLFIETSGGNTDATEKLVHLLQSQARDLRVIVPNAAKSNGTLLSLAAREIVMGPSSELGPIEPSVPSHLKDSQSGFDMRFWVHADKHLYLGISWRPKPARAVGFGPEYAAEACLARADRASVLGRSGDHGNHAPGRQEQADGVAMAAALPRGGRRWPVAGPAAGSRQAGLGRRGDIRWC